MPQSENHDRAYGLVADLLAPIDPESFAQNYWDAEPMLAEGNRPTFQDLYTVEDFDNDLHSVQSSRFDRLRIVKDGITLGESPHGPTGGFLGSPESALRSVYSHFQRGASLVLNRVDQFSVTVAQLCAALEQYFSAGVHANAYLTPAQSSGFHVHYDTHHVFVLQIQGRKRWRLYGCQVPYATPNTPFESSTLTVDKTEPTFTCKLTPGDVLYIPRGHLHDATADELSLHLTIGVTPITWADIFTKAIEKASKTRDFLREQFADAKHLAPSGQVISESTNSLASVICPTELNELFAKHLAEIAERRRTTLRRHIVQMSQADALTAETRVKVRPKGQFRVVHEENGIAIQLDGKKVVFPKKCIPVVEYISTHDTFCVRDLFQFVDSSSAMVLVSRLLREGIAGDI